MVTYDELFQFGLLIVAIVGLVYKISTQKNNRPSLKKLSGYFLFNFKGNRLSAAPSMSL